ncbi:hypothetical protein Vretimale_8848, partial [Volvox reticuliferus]
GMDKVLAVAVVMATAMRRQKGGIQKLCELRRRRSETGVTTRAAATALGPASPTPHLPSTLATYTSASAATTVRELSFTTPQRRRSAVRAEICSRRSLPQTNTWSQNKHGMPVAAHRDKQGARCEV